MARTPKPTALKLVAGERKDRINTTEPVPSAGDVVPPEWLSEEALEVWRTFAADLEAKGVLTPWDAESFAGWCDAVVRRWHAAEQLDQEGEVTEEPVFDRNGKLTGHRRGKNPWLGVWKDANEVVQRVGARFGLTPAERSQLRLGGQGDPDPAARLLS